MDAAAIIIGVLLCLAAVGFLIAIFADGSVLWIGALVVAGVAGGLLISKGVHGENAKFHSKHVSIIRDLTAQGFEVPYDNVNARGGWWLSGTEVDFVIGGCIKAYNVTKLEGEWFVTIPRPDGGVSKLSPNDVASAYSAVC